MINNLKSLYRYITFVAKNFKLFYVVVLLSIFLLFLEYIATSLLIPLAPQQNSSNAILIRAWEHVAHFFQFEPSIRLWLWFFFIVLFFRLILGYFLTVLMTLLGKMAHQLFSDKIFSHIILAESMENIYKRTVGHYITLAGDDTFKSGTIITCMLQGVVGFLASLVGMVLLYFFSPSFFWGMIIFLLINFFFITIVLKKIFRINHESVELSREANTTFIEALNNIRSIRSLHFEKFMIRVFGDQIHMYVRMLLRIDSLKSCVKIFPIIALLFVAIILLHPNLDIKTPDTTLVAGTLILIRIFTSIGQTLTAGIQAFSDIRAIKDIKILVDLAEKKQSTPYPSKKSKITTLKLSKLSYGYADDNIIDNLSFTFKAGKTYAIIGKSGSGKSTLADVLLGFKKPHSGSILINNKNILFNKLKDNIALVEQRPKVFSISARQNLLLGLKEEGDILSQAIYAVNLSDFFKDLEMGLETKLNYQGENFSGGQLQRLGIARALIRKPDVLILDEATSALDPATRSKVVKNVKEWMSDGIIIFITHDYEISNFCDEILNINRKIIG
jgi:ABC-type bacteriocin/lantibiotic exporter with double-glycine peptidase domain